MRLGYELTIEQSQKLSMTPELIQAIQILQLNQQELTEYVENALLENPVLEMEKSEDSNEVDLQAVVMQSAADEWRYSQWEAAADDDDAVTFEQFVSEESSLTDYLMGQLHLSGLNDRKMEIGRYIIEAIDDNGYLTASIDEIAEACHTTPEKAEAVLTFVQGFDPPGVAARNLRECMLIQLEEKGLLTEEIEYLIVHLLEDLAEHHYAQIGKKLGVTVKHVQHVADLLKTLEPKPGRAFASGGGTRYIIPDVLVEHMDGEYIAVSNDGSIPHLMISSYYHHLNEEYKDEELQKYLNERMNAALWLMKSIEQRKQTIHNVTNAIVRYQQDFFEKGEQYLKPLTLRQIAEEVGVHESTVSRTINGKYLQGSRGIFELKYFFTSGVEGEDGNGISSNSVKAIIRELITGENPQKPYSDQELTAYLASRGIAVSRRTVAKYRESMHILSSSKRRRF
ncbi:MAG: RNA polymerase factor sigma-54 [Firmicutes bacterium]|nr:RNA polymerase factor sigma-54 [Bacillota bacterium]